MKTDALGQTLKESLNNPESWLRQAEQQYLVAVAISSEVGRRGPSERDQLLAVGYLNNTVLLLALCVENAFKSVKAACQKFEVDNHGLTKASRGGGGTGHTLIALAEEIGFELTKQETKLLERLTEIGIWAGKYHTPIYHKAFEAANLESPKSITLPTDLQLVERILQRAAKESGVVSVV